MPRRKNNRPQTLQETVYRLYREQYKREYNRNRYRSTTWAVPLSREYIYRVVDKDVEFHGARGTQLPDARDTARALMEDSTYMDSRQMGLVADFYGGGKGNAQLSDAISLARQTLTDRKDGKGLAMLDGWEATHPMPTDSESFRSWFRDAPLVLKKKLLYEYMSTEGIGNVSLQYEGEEVLDL